MIDNYSVLVYEKSVAVFAVALAQNLNQAVDIKIYREATDKFIFFTENQLRHGDTIKPGLRVVVG